MPDTEQTLEHLEERVPILFAAAVNAAYLRALAAGQTVLVSGDGGIYETLPDGTVKMVKPLAKPLSVPVGTRVRIP